MNPQDPPILDDCIKAIQQVREGALNSTKGLTEEIERLGNASLAEKRQAVTVLKELGESLELLKGVLGVLEVRLGDYKVGFEKEMREAERVGLLRSTGFGDK